VEPSATAITSPEPGPTFLGPIVGPDYTPPPTFTPRPTDTSTPRPTEEEPEVTPTRTPTPGPSPTPLPGLDPENMGVQLHSLLDQAEWNEVLRLTQQLELGWAKVQIDWELLQPNPGEISVDFRRQELYIESLKQRGMKVLVSVAKAPAWARSNQAEDGPPDDPQALVDFLNLMLAEFGNAIDAIEIWNEPNLLREWQGRPLNGGEYMRYFTPAYQAINAYSDSMRNHPLEPRSTPIVVVTAGLAPTGTTESSVDDRDYLRQMYAAGLGQFRDNIAIGAHPFPWGNPPDARCCNAVDGQGWDDNPVFFFIHTLEDYRNIMVANGHENVQIWATEFGWATWDEFPGDPPEPWMNYTDKWQQAAHTLRAFEIGQQTDYIGVMILWNMNFAWLPSLIENRDERAAYSLLTPLRPQQERPLYWMLYDAVRPDLQLDRYDAD
ncbi:MAG TPA: hypothetical protein VKY59_09860, partial [Spirillospora sp.]|nr:hypothetical protein [Spirillospora sp.]